MKIHFIGIGGIGVSALARYFLAQGHKVSGSDLEESEITESLAQEAEINIGHDVNNLPDNVDRVIYTAAIDESNQELEYAKKKNIPTQSYAEALGKLTKKYFTIAITGTHGKSTTAAMVASILIEAGLDPTVILGTKFDQLEHKNCRVEGSNFLVIEADEWNRSFLNYYPEILTITNIEEEHLDCYEGLDDILQTYQELISHLPENGKLITNEQDLHSKKLTHNEHDQKFSLVQRAAENLQLKVPGKYNIKNALAALETARALDISDETSFKALNNFNGVWRRFDIKTEVLESGRETTVVNDYAHHPTEVKATLKALVEKFPEQEKWAVFQPHQVARTANLFDEFTEALRKTSIDKLIVTDIYKVAGREEKSNVTSKKLVEGVDEENVIYIPQEELKSFLLDNLKNQVLLIMGAGDIYKLENDLAKK